MTRALFQQSLADTFESSVGEAGMNPARFAHYCDEARRQIPMIASAPQRECAPILAMPSRTDDLEEIEAIANEYANHYEALVVMGMGGSSFGSAFLAHLRKEGGLHLHFVDNIDPHTTALLINQLAWPRTAFLVISKSGNTVETHAQFSVFLREAKARITHNYAKHFTVITIPNENPMHRLAKHHGIRVVAHDTDLGGRYSVLSAVGLIPAAAVGVDIRALRAGAHITMAENFSGTLAAAGEAAAMHMALNEKHINMHVFMHYNDRLGGLARWHRQCWAESLGKQGKGSTLIPSRGASDQHSQLQLYLEGPADKCFTALIVDGSGQGPEIYADGSQPDLAYLSGHTLGDLFMAEQRATNATLVKAGRPLRTITCATLDEMVLGALLMHCTLEVIFTGALMGVNPFDQPAIEVGKRLTLEYLAGK
jgi:glucose-6-phosphate isomerase